MTFIWVIKWSFGRSWNFFDFSGGDLLQVHMAFNKTNPQCLVRINKHIATNKKIHIPTTHLVFQPKKVPPNLRFFTQLDVKIPDLQLPFVQ